MGETKKFTDKPDKKETVRHTDSERAGSLGKYILLAESGADLPAEIVKRYGIEIVPMHVTFGSTTYDDGTFPTEEIFTFYQRNGILPKTSGCAPSDFEIAFDRIHISHPDSHILHLAYSAVTTCSYQSAQIAAKGRDYVTSIDTKHVSAGQALVVLSVARYLEAHPDCSLQEALDTAERLSRQCRMGFFPGDLVYLKAGGRVSNAAYLGAKILSLNPLIEINDGKLVATKKYRGPMKKIAPKLVRDFVEQQKLQPRQPLGFVYSPGLSDEIRLEVEALAKDLGFREILWIRTGGVVSVHGGPGAFGICGFAPEE